MEQYRTFLQSRNLSQTTQKIYINYVIGFLDWYEEDALNASKKNILDYLGYLKKEKQYENITRRNILLALNHYFQMLQRAEEIERNPTNLIKIRGAKRRNLYRTFSQEELAELLDNYYNVYIRAFDERCYASKIGGIAINQRERALLCRQRNYVMLCLLVHQGLQTNELQKIRVEDIDMNKARVLIRGGRKSNDRNIPLNATQIGSLMNYIQNVRPKFLDYQIEENQNLFMPLSEAGKNKTNNTNLMGTLKQLAKQCKGISNEFVRFKQIRASVITYWIQTVGLRKAQYFAGHRFISSTENYLPNDLKSLSEDIGKFNPF